jgi:hypothetical protein
MSEVNAQFNRVKGASWFFKLYKKEVIVLGQGGIGSWLSLLLARSGCDLYTFDMDVYEEHNMTGQLVRKKDVGKNKAEALKEIIQEFSPSTAVHTHGQYNEGSFTGDIVLCGFDNMHARKLAFTKWQEYVEGLPESARKESFFQDGRLLAEQLQIFNIRGDDAAAIKKYKEEWLFDDEEGAEGDCTFKQTSHAAALIASLMVGFLTNWVSGSPRRLPFLHEYVIPLNLANNVDA